MLILWGVGIIGNPQLHPCLLYAIHVSVGNHNFKQIVALSTFGAEYVATIEAIKEALWLKDLLTEINEHKEPVVVYSDGQIAIHLCKNLVFMNELNMLMLSYTLLEM